MKKWLDAIWRPFDREDKLEWYLLAFAYTVLILLLIVKFL